MISHKMKISPIYESNVQECNSIAKILTKMRQTENKNVTFIFYEHFTTIKKYSYRKFTIDTSWRDKTKR